jgi:hypothetical protein
MWRVRASDFTGISAPFRFKDSAAFAHLPGGYYHPGGMCRLNEMTTEVIPPYEPTLA